MIKSVTKVKYLNFGIFSLDVANRELLKDGEHIALTQKSFDILYFLIQNRGKMLKKDEILNVVWTDNFVEEATLAQHIYMIRKVLKDNGDSFNYIETIPKYGYRFIGEIRENSTSSAPLYKIVPTDQSPSQLNGFNSGSVNKPDKTISKRPEEYISERTNPPSPAFSKMHSLLIPNIIFATILTAILFTFIYLAYFAVADKTTDISNIKSISILPFKQIGADKDEKLSLGLADTLISRLGNQNEISISPTASIANFANEDNNDLKELGKKLNVDAILTGTIQKENDSVRVNVQLVSVRENTPLWSDKFDVKFSNVFSLQDEVSEKLAQKLSLELNDNPQNITNVAYSINAKASEEYEKGLLLWENRSNQNLPKVIEHLEKAIALDSEFALAYSHLADAYSLVGFYKLEDYMPSKIALEKAKSMAAKALELNPASSEAHTALALTALSENDPDKAVKLYKKAISLKPGNATAHLRLAWILTTNDSLDDAINEMRLAQKAQPQSPIINTNLARLLRLNRQTDEALAYCKKAVEIAPTNTRARVILAEIYEQKGLLDKSIQELKAVPKDAPEEETAKLLLSRVYAKKGQKTEARQMLRDVAGGKGKAAAPSYEVATIYAHLGEKDEAVKELQKAKEDSLLYFLHIKYDYNVDSLRNSPEYSKILSKSKDKFDKANDKKS
jgi:DNA-binding winged helix-turn-helix (wHTH) protein/TolB-like protein/Tfp pilus assembly protein PilF